ncbi:hypothetical protein OsI_36583 [Oryza sativa Indica Group]|uniref:Uncharacterized protein n=2 Tax=Oryza TaxID=4527 RepID=A0A0E0F6Y6_9ORYZ|nr:hypothetical protein OsI_36583 [Oryza sativa Indica Group]
MGPRTLKSTCTVPCIAGDLPSPSSDGGGGGGAAGAGEREGRGLCGSLQGLVRDLEDGAGGRAGGPDSCSPTPTTTTTGGSPR